jgi:glycosyltransferase involved in cell wall biosynthesis
MKVSVFMPITNPEKRGDTYIEAIKTHLFWCDELVIVDGGSTDGSIEKIKALNDQRIRFIDLPWDQENWSWIEFPKHWNAGLQACTGDWVAAGETDHIFHEFEAYRMRDELESRMKKNFAVLTLNKMQSLRWDQWYSKSKIYYFINKKTYPTACYGFDPNFLTDLCQPIFPDGTDIEGLPRGKAIIEQAATASLVHTLGPTLYNYLWTFKTIPMIMTERMASMRAWNKFPGFTEIHNKRFDESEEGVQKMVMSQLEKIENRIDKIIPFERHPEVMRKRIEEDLKPGMLGYGLKEALTYYEDYLKEHKHIPSSS